MLNRDAWVHMFAVVLEVAIATRLAVHGDKIGLLLCSVYLWWSASLAMVARLWGGPR